MRNLHIHYFRNTEIGQFESAVGSDQNVVRFNVFVYHRFHMQKFKSLQNINEQPNHLLAANREKNNNGEIFLGVEMAEGKKHHSHIVRCMIFPFVSAAEIWITDHRPRVP